MRCIIKQLLSDFSLFLMRAVEQLQTCSHINLHAGIKKSSEFKDLAKEQGLFESQIDILYLLLCICKCHEHYHAVLYIAHIQKLAELVRVVYPKPL